MAPNQDKTPGNSLDDFIDNAMANIENAKTEIHNVSENVIKHSQATINNAKIEMDNVRENVNEATEEQKEAVKSNTEKVGESLPNSAQDAGSQLGGMVDSGVQQAKEALSGDNEKK